MTLARGTVFAGFTIEREIGAGGMGVVYLAHHPRLPREVALKLLRADLVADSSFVGRFRREAETVARLNHPNIVPVDDVGAEDGQLWLSMPYIHGTTAERALAEHPAGLPPDRAVHIVSKVAAALDFAHRNHLVHRDVKPANILLAPGDDDEPERVYLSDFGVVKGMGELEAQRTALTGIGDVIATLDYAAPEQIEGRPLDARCDIYALGCVLYKLLTGNVPYPGESVAAKVYAHLHHPPPQPSVLVTALPPAMDRVVSTAMARDPDDRFPTCRALARAARDALARGSTTVGVAPEPRTTDPRGDQPASDRRPTDDAAQHAPDGGAPAGDGTTVRVAGTARPARPTAILGPSAGLRPDDHAGGPPPGQRIAGRPTDWRPAVAPADRPPGDGAPPDGPPAEVPPGGSRRRQFALIAVGAMVLIAAIVTGAVLLGHRLSVRGTAATGTSSGSAGSTSRGVVAAVGRSGVAGTDAGSGAANPAGVTTGSIGSTGPTGSIQPTGSTGPVLSAPGLPRSAAPLGGPVLIVSRKVAGGYMMSRADSSTGEATDLFAAPTPAGMNPLISRDRRTVLYVQDGSGLHVIGADGRGDRLLGPGLPAGCSSVGRPAWDPVDQNRLALLCHQDSRTRLLLIDSRCVIIGELTTGLAAVDDLSFSSDGKWLGYWGSASGGVGSGAVYVQSVAGRAPIRVSAGPGDVDPVWSPVAPTVAFSRTEIVDGRRRSQILTVDVSAALAGPSRSIPVANPITDEAFAGDADQGPTWSPDGAQLAFKSTRPASGTIPAAPGIWVAAVSGAAPARRLPGPGAVIGSPAWSNR